MKEGWPQHTPLPTRRMILMASPQKDDPGPGPRPTDKQKVLC